MAKEVLKSLKLMGTVFNIDVCDYLSLERFDKNMLYFCYSWWGKFSTGKIGYSHILVNDKSMSDSFASAEDFLQYLGENFLNCCYDNNFNELVNDYYDKNSIMRFYNLNKSINYLNKSNSKPCFIFGCNDAANAIAKNTTILPNECGLNSDSLLICQYGVVSMHLSDAHTVITHPQDFKKLVLVNEHGLPEYKINRTIGKTTYEIMFDKDIKTTLAKLRFTGKLL